ncbi:hypothetical protein [Xanthomonas phage RTH11]|nr:hypothetical protein [Xanthomonas phage RTH11]
MFKKLLPQSEIGKLYLASFTVGTAISLTIAVTQTVVGRVLYR